MGCACRVSDIGVDGGEWFAIIRMAIEGLCLIG